MKKFSSVIFWSFIVLILLLFVNPVNGYSESVESEPIVELPKITPTIPDSKVWKKFTDNWYYNKKSLTKSSNIVSVWTYYILTDDDRKEMIEIIKKFDLEESIKYQHHDHCLTLEKFDCKNKMNKREDSVDYDDEGKVLDDRINKNSEWKNIIPESVMDTLYNKVCVTPKKSLKKK